MVSWAVIYRALFVVPNQQAASQLQKTLPDDCMACGIGAALCGMGTREIISVIDEHETEQIWDWFNCTILTRLVPGGKKWPQSL